MSFLNVNLYELGVAETCFGLFVGKLCSSLCGVL